MPLPIPLRLLPQRLAHARRSLQARARVVARLTAQLVFEAWVFHPHHNKRMETLSLLTSLSGSMTIMVTLVGFFIALLLGGKAMALEDLWAVLLFIGILGAVSIAMAVAIVVSLLCVHEYCFEPADDAEGSRAAWDKPQGDVNALFRQRCKQLVQVDTFHHMSAGEWFFARRLWGFEETPQVRHKHLDDVLPMAPATSVTRTRF